MKNYQLKVARKKTKPPVWTRCLIPSGISFSQLSVILNEITGEKDHPVYLFEFYQKGLHIKEDSSEQSFVPDSWHYDLAEATRTWIDELMEQEEWFSYTLADGTSYRVTIERTKQEQELPYPVIIKSKGCLEKDGEIENLNSICKSKFYVNYGLPQPVSQKQLYEYFDAGNSGLSGNLHPINNPEDVQKCSRTILSDFAQQIRELHDVIHSKEDDDVSGEWLEEMNKKLDIFNQKLDTDMRNCTWNRLSPEIQEDAQKCRRISLKTVFEVCSKPNLTKYAKNLHLVQISNLNKAELAEKIANDLLMPSVMKRKLWVLDDKKIELFERVGNCGEMKYQLSEEEKKIGRELFVMRYIAIDIWNLAEVPVDVWEVYSRINTEEFQEQRKKIVWMLKCLDVANALYCVTPIGILRRLYRRKPGFRATTEELVEIFRMIPSEENPCIMAGDKIIDRQDVEDDTWQDVEEEQGNGEFYIPTWEEIEDFTEYGYFPNEEGYMELRRFLERSVGKNQKKMNNLISAIYWKINLQYKPQEIVDFLYEKDERLLPDDQSLEMFVHIMAVAHNHTRTLYHRGFTPDEFYEMARGKEIYMEKNSGRRWITENASILPFPGAAFEAAPGQTVPDSAQALQDAGGNAQNAGGNAQPFGKKIYPNDPCPCGSGKKYKKCCGRKK